MTDRDEQVRWGEVVREYAELLGIDHRRFVVEFDDDLEDWGQMANHQHYPNSTLVLGPLDHPDDPANWPFVEREETIAHELVHVLTQGMRQLMGNTIGPHLPKNVRKTFWNLYDHEEEKVAESVARALVAAKRGEKRPGKIMVREASKGKGK